MTVIKVAVTGAGGFLGINLVRHLAGRGHEVVAIDIDFADRARAAIGEAAGVVIERADVLDATTLTGTLKRHRPAALFHGATLTADLARERRDFSQILAVNVVGTGHVLEAALAAGVKQTIVASSSAVYGDAVFSGSPKETDAVRPVSLYGISKLAAEQAALRFGHVSGMDVVAARISAVFGAWEHRSGARDAMSPLFQVAEKAVAGEPALLPDGGGRDWIDSGRVAAILAAMLERDRLEHRLYNVSAASTWLPQTLGDCLRSAFPDFLCKPAGDAGEANIDYRDDLTRRRHSLDTRRIRQEFGPDVLGEAAADAARFASWVSSHPHWFSNDNGRN